MEKTYTVTDNGKTISRTNDGFNLFELSGMFRWILRDIESILDEKSEPHPDQISRVAIKHKDKDCTLLIEAAKDFINKVNTGKAKSKDSYQKFIDALKSIEQ